MRKTRITVLNTPIDLFLQESAGGWRYWMVGPHKGKPTVLVHYGVANDMEARLHLAHPGDLKWTDATDDKLPATFHRTCRDYVAVDGQVRVLSPKADCAMHLALHSLADRPPCGAAAAGLLAGSWESPHLRFHFHALGSMELEPRPGCPGSHLIKCSHETKGYQHWLLNGWQLCLMNEAHTAGDRFAVLSLSSDELHLPGRNPDQFAEVFSRVS